MGFKAQLLRCTLIRGHDWCDAAAPRLRGGRSGRYDLAMIRPALSRLALTDFRSYEQMSGAFDGRPVALFGPNGAGKTNLLEAISFLAPGRGLRGARAGDVARRSPGDETKRSWSVFAQLETRSGSVRLGTGLEAGSARRQVRLDGETASPGRLSEIVRLVWMSPQQDRLFLEGGSERRRFLDRLTFAATPEHAVAAAAYEKAMRERLRLLVVGPNDVQWLDALEAQAAVAGTALAAGRLTTVRRLQHEIDARADRPFPQAMLSLSGEWGQGEGQEDQLRQALRQSREQDRTAGRSLAGPQRTDLLVLHREKNRPAGECSTGEQKALILNLVLASGRPLGAGK